MALFPDSSLEDLRTVFPNSLNPDSGVKINFVDASTIDANSVWRGYFDKPEELIATSDGTRVAVVSMWTKPSFERLVAHAAQYGIEVDPPSVEVRDEPCGFRITCVDDATSPSPAIIQETTPPAPMPEETATAEPETVEPEPLPAPPVRARGAFAEQLLEDLTAFLQQNNELFFNEKDFQLHVALHLMKTGHYDDVDVEYYLPYREFGEDYIWKNALYVDVVVRKGDEYIPVELKYPTRRVASKIDRFGEALAEDVVIVKDQGAQNFVAYDFWKDVRRIELVKKRFSAVNTGFAIMLTNDSSFMRSHRETANCLEMSIEEGLHSRSRHWQRPPGGVSTGTYVNFDLDVEYYVQWTTTAGLEGFYYCIIEV